MRLLSVIMIVVCSFGRPAASAFAQDAPSMDARSIIVRSDSIMRGATQQGTYTMTIIRPDWERSTTFAFWSKGTELSFIRVREPARDRGIAFLKRDREMWNFIPRVNRVIKIPPSMMLQSWMGSDFTNDDLVKESSVVDDYEHALIGVDTLDAGVAWHVSLTPLPETPVAWDRVEEWVRQEDYVSLKAVYFNERGEEVRTILFEDVRHVDDRRIPLRMVLLETSKPGHKTILQLDDVTFNEPIPDRIFSQQHLRSGG